MSMSPVRYTQRGFPIYAEFKDRDGAHVDITASSLATESCVRVHVVGDEEAYARAGLPPNNGSLHLTPAMARKVIAALNEWLDEVAVDAAVEAPHSVAIGFDQTVITLVNEDA
jgi:hypothetical protein